MHLAHMWGRGIAPVPTSYFPEPFRLGPVPHTGHLARAIKLHRQNTSLDQGVASWDGAMPRPLEFVHSSLDLPLPKLIS
jgi:hypothetical protein